MKKLTLLGVTLGGRDVAAAPILDPVVAAKTYCVSQYSGCQNRAAAHSGKRCSALTERFHSTRILWRGGRSSRCRSVLLRPTRLRLYPYPRCY